MDTDEFLSDLQSIPVVAWFSRYPMKTEQSMGLRRLLKNPFTVLTVEEPFANAAKIIRLSQGAQFIAGPWLPNPGLVADLMLVKDPSQTILLPRYKKTWNAAGLREFLYDGWEKVEQAVWVTKTFS